MMRLPPFLLLLIASLGTAAPQPPSDVEISWSILEHQILGNLPNTFSKETPIGKLSLQRRTGKNYSQSIQIGVKAPEFVLEDRRKETIMAEPSGTRTSTPGQTQTSPAQTSLAPIPAPSPSGPPLPRQGGSDLKLTSTPPSGVTASFRPSRLSVEQDGPTHVKIPHLKIESSDLEIEVDNVEMDISGISLKLDNAIELRADASITEKDGIPKLTRLAPSVRVDPSKISIDCEKLELKLPIQFSEMTATDETTRILRDQACQFLNSNVATLWGKHEATVLKSMEALEAPLMETANQQLEKMVKKQLEDAVRLSIHGLEVTQNSLYVGVGATGRRCGALADPAGVSTGEMAVRLSTADINAALARNSIRSFDLGDGLGTVTLNKPPVLVTGPGVEEGTYDIEFDGTLVPAAGSKLPVLPGSQPPYSAKGKIRVKPTGKNGEVKLELMRSADFTISDRSGNNVQVKQDSKGGTISTPKATVNRMVDGAISAFSGNSTLMIYDGKRLRRDLKICRRDGIDYIGDTGCTKQFGYIRHDANGSMAVVGMAKTMSADGMQVVQTREVDFQGTKATLIGKPTTRGTNGNIVQADLLIDITAENLKKVKPDLGGLESLGEYVFDGKTSGGKKVSVSHLTMKVGADLKLDAKGEKLAVGVDKVRDFDISNLDPNVRVGFKGWAGGVIEDWTSWDVVTDGVKGAIQGARNTLAGIPMVEVKKTDVGPWKALESTIGDGVNVSNFNFGSDRFEMKYQFTSPNQSRLIEVATIKESELVPDAYQGWAHLKSARVRNGRLELRLTEGSGASSSGSQPR